MSQTLKREAVVVYWIGDGAMSSFPMDAEYHMGKGRPETYLLPYGFSRNDDHVADAEGELYSVGCAKLNGVWALRLSPIGTGTRQFPDRIIITGNGNVWIVNDNYSDYGMAFGDAFTVPWFSDL